MSASGSGAVWHAVHAKRHCEEKVDRRLRQQGFGTLLPLIEIVRYYRRRQVTLLEPLFPGYLFVRMAAGAQPGAWDAVRWAPGVRSILTDGDGPAPVPDEVIGAIHDRVRDLGFVRPGPAYRPGQLVRIRHGPFAGLEAVFDRPISREGRVRVLLALLGQPRSVELGLADLEPA